MRVCMNMCMSYCHACLCVHIRTSVCLPCVFIQTFPCTFMCLHAYSMCSETFVCVCVGVCQCVYARTVATSITQSRELQSVKSTLTFMVLTSQGHPKAEHLEWSVTFQTENNSRVFSGLWRRLFILSLTLIHFDLARGNNGLNTLIFPLLYCSHCLCAPLSFACRLPLTVSLFSKRSPHVTMMTGSWCRYSTEIKRKTVCSLNYGRHGCFISMFPSNL